MRPGSSAIQQAQTRERESVAPDSERPLAEAFVLLTDEQRRLIDVLQSQRDGMTVRQLEAKLSRPSGEVVSLLESVLERRLVGRLNTIVPSYVYRYGGVNLGAD